MKKLILLGMLMGCFSLIGQKSHPVKFDRTLSADVKNSEKGVSTIQQKILDTELIPVGQASNIWSILNADQNQVHYDPALNALSFVHRQNLNIHDMGGSGTVRYDISYDKGASWDVDLGPITPLMESTDASIPITTLAGDDIVRGCRYPNGLIFNPTGGSDINDAYYVGVGPALFTALGDAVGWGVTFAGSQKLDGSAPNQEEYLIYFEDEALGGDDSSPTSLVQGGDAVYFLVENGTSTATLVYKGTENGDNTGVEWNATEFIVDWKLDAGGSLIYTGVYNLAFSADGSVGYAVLGGATNNQVDSLFVPIVYSTTDQGATWVLASDDFLMGETESGQLMEGRPYLRNFDCVVDVNGALHVFGEVMQLTEDYSTFTYEGYMVDYIWDGSSWSEIIIGTIDNESWGVYVGSFQDPYQRPQASITADGTVAIFSWLSSPGSDINDLPDIFARAVDATTGYTSEVRNLTDGSDAEEASHYATASPVLITDGDDFDYELPAVVMADWAGDDLAETQYYYVKGIGFDAEELVGVEEVISPLNNFMAYPNPANSVLSIAFDVDTDVEMSANLYNSIGELIATVASSDLFPGRYSYEIETRNYPAGIYTLEVIANGTLNTKKITVLH